MSERTVQGVPLSEVAQRLSAPFPDSAFRTNKATGIKYLPVDAYLQRLEESFGIFQYDLEVTQPLIVECKGTLTLASTAKVIITKQPWAINVAEIIAVVKYGGKVMNAAIERNDGHKKLLRNKEDLALGWDDLLAETERGFITTMEPLHIEAA